jgi:hypothetical protein
MARFLRDKNGWLLGTRPDPRAEAIYLSAYFEIQRFRAWPEVPVGAYLTHREENESGKSHLFDQVAQRVNVRVVTCALYGRMVEKWGATVQAAAPLERERFTLTPRKRPARPVVGLSGYTYMNKRKGEDLIRAALASKVGQKCEWRGSGRGWPVPTQRYSWAQMPGFYQGLDVLVVASRVEGIPMPPLEALACGVQVVVPRGVGILDELPNVPGIWRYEKGNAGELVAALERAVECKADREQLRAVTQRYSVEQWCQDVEKAMESAVEGNDKIDAGFDESTAVAAPPVELPRSTPKAKNPRKAGTGSTRGIYCVAFGEPSRKCARRLIDSIHKFMPDIPIALCAAEPLGGETLFIKEKDSDIGGRRAKLKAYELAPAEWQSVLYLDADTEVVAPIYRYFEWIEDGWELVICKDPHLMDTMHSFKRANNAPELAKVEHAVKTLHTLQYNGGVWAFGRSERIAAFFARWQREWELYAQRDQGALIRAMYADPLRVLVLGNEWNTFPKYTRGITTAGLMHYPGDARRWDGLIPGRIDSPEAWAAVRRHEAKIRGR